MSDQPDNKVLIVGAGIGGLALAQGLRKHNIPYEIFERDANQLSRKQGWAVALLEALNCLPELLPSDVGDVKSTSVNAALPETAADDIALVDFETGERLGFMGKDTKGKSHLLRAGREHLRNFLWNHVPVSTGKQFSHYETTSSGVTVYFKDGSSATGSILIGADGASSHVRGQMLGPEHSTPELSNFIPIFAEVTLTEEQYLPIASIGNAGYIGGNTNFRIAVGHRGINPNGTADYFLVACYHSANPTDDSSWVQHATKQELFDKCQHHMNQLPSSLRYIMSLLRPEDMVTPPPRFLEFIPPSTMPRGRITLLGDAAHAMTPFRGAGANTAVEDAADLARLIVQRHQQLSDDTQEVMSWEDLLDQYNAIMTTRGQRVVLASRNAGRKALSRADVADRLVNLVPMPAKEGGPEYAGAAMEGRVMVVSH